MEGFETGSFGLKICDPADVRAIAFKTPFTPQVRTPAPARTHRELTRGPHADVADQPRADRHRRPRDEGDVPRRPARGLRARGLGPCLRQQREPATPRRPCSECLTGGGGGGGAVQYERPGPRDGMTMSRTFLDLCSGVGDTRLLRYLGVC